MTTPPTVDNLGQADSDHDGIGDVVDGATISAADASLSRNQAGTLEATLENGNGDPIADQTVAFSYDADGDDTDETYTGTTDSNGTAQVQVTPTHPVGPAGFTADWDGGRGLTASDSGTATVRDSTSLTMLDVVAPKRGDAVAQATLRDSDGDTVPGKTVSFYAQAKTSAGANFVLLGSAQTNASGVASFTVPRRYSSVKPRQIRAQFAGDADYGLSEATAQLYQAK